MPFSYASPAGKFRRLSVLFCLIALLAATGNVLAQKSDGSSEPGGSDPLVVTNPVVSRPVYPHIIDIDLRELTISTPWKPGDAVKEIPRKMTSRPKDIEKPLPQIDPLLDLQESTRASDRAFNTTIINRNGQGYSGVNPPDTTGDVGIDYYIQSINGSGGATYVIYNKSDGSVAAGPFSMDALGAGNCATGLGDPIILYDELASRWMISEFSSSGNRMCVYVSQTSNPISGGWYNYDFQAPSFPDYPKYGVWPDAYYVGANESSPSLYAFDRIAMLNGQPATSQRFTVSSLSGFGFQMVNPADLDGATPPPSGAPAVFMRHKDDEVHGGNTPGQDFLQLFEFHVDWNTPANSSLTGPIQIPIAEIDSSLCGLSSFNCFPQPGSSTTLDPLREVVMFRLAYRNFGSHQSLVGNLVTDVNGADRGGIRWFELRNTGSGWSLFQEGTWSPDATNRWMGGIAMDSSGNIALAYNVSDNSSTYPGLRYVGRLATDPPGTMTQGEFTIVSGSGANSSNRYGDYASMSVDPADGCTFWFTGMYNTSGQWSTRIASFSFDACGCTPPPVVSGLSAANNGNNRIDLSWNTSAGATSYNVYRAIGSCPQGSYSLLASGVATTSYSDTSVSGGVTYAYVVRSVTDSCEAGDSNCSSQTATGACAQPPTFGGIDAINNLQQSGCALQAEWSPASLNCGTAVTYNLYRSTTPGFTPSAGNLIASCINGTSYDDTSVSSGVTYYYIVRAEDNSGSGSGPCANGNEDGNTNEGSGTPTGPNTIYFSDDMEGGTANWTTSGTGGTPWAQVTTASNSPTHSYFTADEASLKDQSLAMAANINLPAGGASMSFYHNYVTESTYDGGVLEYSTDSGSTWSDIGAARITQNGYNATISTSYSSAIGGRQAWSGNSGGWLQTTVDLSDFSGNIRFRWRLACDTSVASTGWYVDDIAILAGSDCGGGPVCTYNISPSSANYAAAGGSGSVGVTADAGCAWVATANNAWISITAGGSGSGNGSVSYSVAANTGAARSGSLTIAGKTFSVTQDAASGPGQWVELLNNDFETGTLTPYLDGGADCRISSADAAFAHQGTWCVRLQDNSGVQSSFYSGSNINLTGYSELRVTLWVMPVSMETGEDLFVEFSSDGGTTWQTIGNYASGTDFSNDVFFNPDITISSSNYSFNGQARLRFRCDASGNADRLYIDEVVVSAR